ncbi:MAG TPA: class I SAM-dependent methyltransferase [Clostridia bacterium]|nr:class I SAM-dependent methyltransferase [Clostridia bacterium]
MERDIKEALEILGRGEGKALDIGTGRGRLATALAEYGYQVVSIDENKEALIRTRGLLEEEGILNDILLIHGDAHNLPFLDETFEVVATYNAMHHMRDYKKVLDEMVRVCKKGGSILISELNEYGKKVVAERHKERGSHHEANISIEDIAKYLKVEYALIGEIKQRERTDIFISKK